MSVSITSTAGIGSSSGMAVDNSSQIAALEKQLLDLQKQLTQASASGASATGQQLVQSISQEITMVEAQISQLQQQSTAAKAPAAPESAKPTAAQREADESNREARVRAAAASAGSSIGTTLDVFA